MPGKIIKLFDTQADWESGTLSNMDSTTKPGSIAPNPSFSKTYTVGASLDWYNWKQGASIQFLYEEGELVNPQRMIDGNITTYAQKMPRGYTASMVANYSTARQFSGIRIYQGPLAKGNVRLFRDSTQVFGWTSLTANGGWKTINFTAAQSTHWKLEISQDTIIYEIDLLPTDYYLTPKTWTSAWTAFGISGSFTSTFTLNATIPSGTSVKKYVRYSSTGQDNPTWQEITGSSLPGTGGNYIQFKIELSTTDTSKTPTVSSFSVTAGPEVYWISPVIDTSKSKSDRLTIGVETDMDIKRSIRASNYTFARPSVAYKSDGTQVSANVPRFEAGKFGKAVLVEEGTENLTNPAHIYEGTWVTVDYSWERRTDIPCNPGDTFTISADVRNCAGRWGSMAFRNEVDEITSFTAYSYSSDEIRQTLTVGPAPEGTILFRVYWVSTNSSSTYEGRNFQIEKKPYATSFIDGTRSPEILTIPGEVMPDNEGTITLWARKNDVQAARARKILDAESPRIDWQWSAGGDYFVDFGGANFGIPDPAVDVEWHFYAITYSGRTVNLYFDGVKVGTGTATVDLVSFSDLTIGSRFNGTYQADALIDDLRISSIARSDAEILANYQSGKPVGFDSYTTYYEPFDGLYDWQVVGVVFENPHTVSLQVKIEPSKTKVGTQYIDSLGLWDTITLPMLERPDIEIAPPECNKITVYTDTTEKSAIVPGTSSDRIVEIRVEAPEDSSETYCQQMADIILAAKSKERISITCKVPLVTSLRFGELVPVILPYIGATIDTPYMAHVQRMEHHILENPPYTILSLGDFLPDDIEALVRLLKEG